MKTLAELTQEQERLTFPEFTNKTALSLGLSMIDKAVIKGCAMDISITLNQREVFKYGMPGTTPMNDIWLQRKVNTVYKTAMSSLRTRAFFDARNSTFFENWFVSPSDYADVGGGFPITLDNGVIVGVICVSGLPHEQDHDFIVETLEAFLKK